MAKAYMIENIVIYNPSIHTLYSKENDEYIRLAVSSSLCFHLLIQNRGTIITQAELLQSAWGERGMNVTSSTLYQNISLLRKALSRLNVSDLVIQTIPKRGFMVSNEITILVMNDEEEKRFDSVAPVAEVHTEEVEINTYSLEDGPYSEEKRYQPISLSLLWRPGKIIPGMDLIAIVTLITLIIILYFIRSLSITTYFSNYNTLPDIKGCTALWESDLNDETYFSTFLKEKNISCSGGRTLYLTNYYPSSRTSVISCQKPINSKKRSYCSSTYYLK